MKFWNMGKFTHPISIIILFMCIFFITTSDLNTKSCQTSHTSNLYHMIPQLLNESVNLMINSHGASKFARELMSLSLNQITEYNHSITCEKIQLQSLRELHSNKLQIYRNKIIKYCQLNIPPDSNCCVFQRNKSRKLLHNLKCRTIYYDEKHGLCSLLRMISKCQKVYTVHGFQMAILLFSTVKEIHEIIWLQYYDCHKQMAKFLNRDIKTHYGLTINIEKNFNDDQCYLNYTCREYNRKLPILYYEWNEIEY
jgi:hypothetical protein